MSTVVRTASCFTPGVSHTCHKYGTEESSTRLVKPPCLGFTPRRWVLLWVVHYAEGIRETDWGESVASLLCGRWRKVTPGGDFAKDQPRVWEIDRVAADRGRPEVKSRGEVRGPDFS